MTPIDLVLGIILELLKAWNALEPGQRNAAWERHEKRLAFWQDVFEKLQPTVITHEPFAVTVTADGKKKDAPEHTHSYDAYDPETDCLVCVCGAGVSAAASGSVLKQRRASMVGG